MTGQKILYRPQHLRLGCCTTSILPVQILNQSRECVLIILIGPQYGEAHLITISGTTVLLYWFKNFANWWRTRSGSTNWADPLNDVGYAKAIDQAVRVVTTNYSYRRPEKKEKECGTRDDSLWSWWHSDPHEVDSLCRILMAISNTELWLDSLELAIEYIQGETSQSSATLLHGRKIWREHHICQGNCLPWDKHDCDGWICRKAGICRSPLSWDAWSIDDHISSPIFI